MVTKDIGGNVKSLGILVKRRKFTKISSFFILQFAKNTLLSYQKQLKQRDMKAKRTMITVLPTREDLSKEEKEHLNSLYQEWTNNVINQW